VLLLRDGKRGEAVAQFDEALRLDPSNEEARKNREQALGH
jgi:Flp pilus assembly protein TadD